MKKLKSLFLLPALLIAGLTGCSSAPDDATLLDMFTKSTGLLLNEKGDPVYSDKTTYATFGSEYFGLEYQNYEGKDINISWESNAPAGKETTFTKNDKWKPEDGARQISIFPWYGYHTGDDYALTLTATVKIGELSAKTEFKFNVGKASVIQTTLPELNETFLRGTTKKGFYELSGIITATYDDAKDGIFVSDGNQGLAVSSGYLTKVYDPKTMPIGTKIRMIGHASKANNNFKFAPTLVSIDKTTEVAAPINVTISSEEDLDSDTLKGMQGRIITATGITYVGKAKGSSSKFEFKYGEKSFMIRIMNISDANKTAIDAKLASLTANNVYDVTFALRWDKDSKGEFPYGVFVASEGKTVVESIVEHVE